MRVAVLEAVLAAVPGVRREEECQPATPITETAISLDASSAANARRVCGLNAANAILVWERNDLAEQVMTGMFVKENVAMCSIRSKRKWKRRKRLR